MASGYSRRFQGNKLLYELEGMPLIAHTLQKLLKRSDGEHIICTSCNGSYRNPAIFPRKYYRELLELQGEQGGKQLLKKYTETVLSVECDSHQLRDIDQKTDI